MAGKREIVEISRNPNRAVPFRHPPLDTHHLWIFRLNDSIHDSQLNNEAHLIAEHHGLTLGPNVANLKQYYWAYQRKKKNNDVTALLENPHPSIAYHEPQIKKQFLFKRTILAADMVYNITDKLGIHDPKFKEQWHLAI
ncbi:hypothetical protein HMI55_004002 [Coelomomyces lativittatus]|nr:hypothetical protein HMI55_004002 [Coelomomyces lativittatus]